MKKITFQHVNENEGIATVSTMEGAELSVYTWTRNNNTIDLNYKIGERDDEQINKIYLFLLSYYWVKESYVLID